MRTLIIASSCAIALIGITAQAQIPANPDLGGKEDALAPAQASVPFDTPPDAPALAPTPVASDTAATVGVAAGPVFRAKVGNYPMSHYASPSRPIPYPQLDAYLKVSRAQQMARNWWTGSELASTATSGNVAATVSANSTAGIPGDTNVTLNADTQAPISDVQRQLNASGLSGTPTAVGRPTAAPGDALNPGATSAQGTPEPTP